MIILVAVDFSEATQKVIDACRFVARSTNARTWLLHIAEPEPDFVGYDAGPEVVRDQVAEEYRREHRAIQKLADQLRDEGLEATALLVQGPTVDTTLQEAERLKADLLVIGSHGYGAVYDLLVGSVSRGILKKSTIPVLVIPVRQ
jgi:nucleotide-binding universal stress UspA family protein